MQLSQLLKAIRPTAVHGSTDTEVSALTPDSRQVQPGTVFVAVNGPGADGHKYIDNAVQSGATAVVCEQLPASLSPGVTYVTVPNSAAAMGHLASEWYGNPSRRLQLIGVTGTNGKTTIATLLYETARNRGEHAGLLSTVENRIDDDRYPTVNTTPSAMETNRLLAQMVERGCTMCAMEVSSHGVVQHRIDGLHFSGAIFTNLTRDHLDYHKTFAAYLQAKKGFFDMLPPTAWALVNADDANGAVMLQNTRARRYSYSLRSGADFTGQPVESRIDGTLMRLGTEEVETRLSGRFNAANMLAVWAANTLRGIPAHDAAVLASTLVPPPGRFETFVSADGVTAVVDYAHTPDALANVLRAINAVKRPDSRITTVTGAGGDRDKGKRPLMGAEAARQSFRVVVTSDNPRNEDPQDIADDICNGIPVDSPAKVDVILERAAAIAVAIADAAPGDIVLIAGKGHEDYQEFENHRRMHFDDREQAIRQLRCRGL